jgi:hypothetical protein
MSQSPSAFFIVWAALKHRPASVLITLFLCTVTAALVGQPVPVAIVAWLVGGIFVVGAWLLVEPLALQRFGCRRPFFGERERFAAALQRDPVEVVVAHDNIPWICCGLRTTIVSQAALEILDDDALTALMTQTAARQRQWCLARELFVWLGNAPLVGIWLVDRSIHALGRLLALAIGSSLIVPLLLWPNGFVSWGGRLIGVAVGGLLGSVLLSGGLAALGLGLLVGTPLVLGLRALLAWEARGAETVADRATLSAGLGQQLRDALEALAVLESPRPSGWLRVFVRAGAPLHQRIARLEKELSAPVGM